MPTISSNVPVAQQRPQQAPFAAAEVEHALRAPLSCRTPSDRSRRCSFRLIGRSTASSSPACCLLGRVGVGLVLVEQARERVPREAALVLQVAAGDQLALRVARQPALAVPQQLLDLVVADPVVLVVVEHGDQHVEVREQLREPAARPQRRR